MIAVKRAGEQISFDGMIERIAPEVPRFIVYAGEAWDETKTFTVDVSLNGVSIGLRNLIPWEGRGWHFGLSQPMCRQVGADTGDRVHVEMRRVRDTRPEELQELLESDPKAEKAWDALSAARQRDFILFIAGAKKSETRMRRARRLLDH